MTVLSGCTIARLPAQLKNNQKSNLKPMSLNASQDSSSSGSLDKVPITFSLWQQTNPFSGYSNWSDLGSTLILGSIFKSSPGAEQKVVSAIG